MYKRYTVYLFSITYDFFVRVISGFYVINVQNDIVSYDILVILAHGARLGFCNECFFYIFEIYKPFPAIFLS